MKTADELDRALAGGGRTRIDAAESRRRYAKAAEYGRRKRIAAVRVRHAKPVHRVEHLTANLEEGLLQEVECPADDQVFQRAVGCCDVWRTHA